MNKVLLLAGLLFVVNAQAGELYRSVDKDGKVHYSDSPLQGADDVEELRMEKAPAPDETLPYETQRAKQNFPVTLYVHDNCGDVCQQSRDFLNKRGIPFSEKKLATQEEFDTFRKDSGDAAVPKLTVGRTWIRGFLAEQWNKELDLAGYPKTAPYRPQPVAPKAQPAQ